MTNFSGATTTAEIDVHSLDVDGKTELDTGASGVALDGANDAFVTGTMTLSSIKAFTV